MPDLPLACTLDPSEFARRRDTLLPGLITRAHESQALPDGTRWRFARSHELPMALAVVIEAEQRCCPFLRFEIDAEPEGRVVWLAVAGPPGTREFLARLPRRGVEATADQKRLVFSSPVRVPSVRGAPPCLDALV